MDTRFSVETKALSYQVVKSSVLLLLELLSVSHRCFCLMRRQVHWTKTVNARFKQHLSK